MPPLKLPNAPLSNGARAKRLFVIGVILVSASILLGIFRLVSLSYDGSSMQVGISGLIVALTMLIVSMIGLLLLQQYPRIIAGLRRRTEGVIAEHLSGTTGLPQIADDVAAIEQGMTLAVNSLRERLTAAESSKLSLDQQLLDAEKLRTLGLMAGGIAHDFGNIMCVISGTAQMAQRSLQDTVKMEGFLRTISNASQQASDLTQQMLAMASGQQAERTRVNVSTAISQIADLLRSSAGSVGKMNFNLAENVFAVESDATQIRQIVLNLVFNAADATDSTGSITIATCKRDFTKEEMAGMSPPENAIAGPYACIEVSDTGCGMDEETRLHLFDAFYTTKMGGRGLGLSVVLGIVRRHKGLVGVTVSTPGKGSTFRVLLPRRAVMGSPVKP